MSERIKERNGSIRLRRYFSSSFLLLLLFSCCWSYDPGGHRKKAIVSHDDVYQINLKIRNVASRAAWDNTAANKALCLLESLKDPDTVSYNTVLKALAKSGQASQAEELLLSEDMQKKADVVSYSTVMDAWCRVKDPRRAHAWLRRLEERSDLEPNTVCYNTVMASYAKSNLGTMAATRAASILEAMPHPDVISYNSVLLAWARSGDAQAGQKAQALLMSMERPNTRSYATVLDAWSRSSEGAAEHAHALLRQLETKYQQTRDPSIRPNAFCYTSTIKCYTPQQPHQIWKLLQHMEHLYESGENTDARPTDYTYNAVLNALAVSRGGESMLLSVYRRMLDADDPKLRPNRYTYGTMLKACANTLVGNTELRVQLCQQIFLRSCCEGQLSFGVCYQFHQAAPREMYYRMLPPDAIDPTNGHFIYHKLPRYWYRNVPPNERSR